jgi:hypothetical protein
MEGGWDASEAQEFGFRILPVLVFVLLPLVPWWRAGWIARVIGYTIFVLAGLLVLYATVLATIDHLHLSLFCFLILTTYITRAVWFILTISRAAR